MDNSISYLYFLPLPIILTWFLLDIVRKLSIKLKIFAIPNERSSHDKIIPTTGGVALCLAFLSVLFFYNLLVDFDFGNDIYYFAVSGVIISIVGFYDDINEMGSFIKLILQIFVFFIISLADNNLINSFHGLFGIYELGYYESITFSLFVFIVIVNSINLVDGIDGLSSSLSLYFLVIVSYFFYIASNPFYLLSISFSACVLVFIFFNYSKKNKIFLGDTGSLGLGLVLAVISLGWLNTNQQYSVALPINPALFTVLMIAYPLLDVIRVFLLRIYKGESFMVADRNHLHHKLINIGLSHFKSVILILFFQSSLLLFNVFIIPELSLHYQIIVNIIVLTFLLVFLYRIPDKSVS